METNGKESSRPRPMITRQGGRDQRSISASSGAPCIFVFSGFSRPNFRCGSTARNSSQSRDGIEKKQLKKKIRALGGIAHNETTVTISKCTHFIYKPGRNIPTCRFLCGVASGKWILKPEFITDSFTKGKWQPESMYEWNEGDVSENVVPGLLTAPRRWREKIAASGHGAFHDWKVLLHVTNDRSVGYRSVLEAGGGQCVSVNLPFEELAGPVSSVTHVIMQTWNMKDIQFLEARGIPCLLPGFIREYLFQENPNMTQYRVSSALMTPPETIRQRNIPTVKAKKDHDTFPKSTPRTRSQGKQADTAGREGDTPGSTMSIAEEGTSSDPGKGVKRKLHFPPNQLREAPLILKKKKLSSQHLPLIPYAMLMPTSKKAFQCASDVCPSSPFSANICNSIEASIEESHWLDALSCIGSSISTLQYPPPHILYSIMEHILMSSSLTVCHAIVDILNQVLRLHSPACYVSLRGLYLDSMVRPPGIFKAPYHNEPWQFVDAVIRRALGGQHIIQNVKDPEDEEAIKVAMETGKMLLHFLVSLFEEDFMASAWRTNGGTEQHTGPSRCILAQILWPSVMEQASRKVPVNVQMLITRFIQAVEMAAKCDDWVPVTSLLSTLMVRAAEIHVVSGELPGNKNPEKGRKEFAKELASGAKQEGILAIRSCQEMFLSMLKPCVWLCMSVAECILHNYADQLLGEDRNFWVDQLQTIGNTVSYYFSLVQSTASLVQKEDTGKSESSPLKTISNQQLTCKNGEWSPKSSPRKTNVNRKNAKGETPLHVACIKNNITRVRELLKEPDIDVNTRDNAEWTPLHEACIHGHTACVKELLKFTSGKRMVTNSGTEIRSMQTLDLLAAPSECGTTPLHDAVTNNHIEVVKLLVAAGGMSVLTVKNKAGLTPPDLAKVRRRSEVSILPAVDVEFENNASTSKAPNVRRCVKGGSRLHGNTKVKDRSTETLPSSKPNLGKDEGSTMARLPSAKDDASVTSVSFSTMDEQLLLHHIAKLVPMRKVIDLGTALRFEHVQIKRYVAQNDHGPCKFEGTLDMLHDWTLKQKDKNIPGLIAALEEAGMNKLSKSLKLNTL